MPASRKIALVSPHWTAYVHRLLRGALTYTDSHPHTLIRDFRLPLCLRTTSPPDDTLNQLRTFNPDGLLGLLDDELLQKLLRLLPRPCPVVCMSNVPVCPGVAVVSASFPAALKAAVRHFRQQGLRSLALLQLEVDPQRQTSLEHMFKEIVRPANPAQAVCVQAVAPDLLDDPDASVSPVPERLAAWLRELPRPSGVFCSQTGGGGYIIRCCNALGLRVPQELAVIGVDDIDLSLASSPTLTSVVPVGESIGFEAMRVLDQMMAGTPGPRERVRLEAVDLHVRQSTALERAEVCDIAAAVDYIHQHACRGVTVTELLQATQHVSRMTFIKHFKAATGQNPGQAIRRRQMEEARRLLAETELAVTLVAERTGFGSSNDFARRFRALEGQSPSDYRRHARRREVVRPAKS